MFIRFAELRPWFDPPNADRMLSSLALPLPGNLYIKLSFALPALPRSGQNADEGCELLSPALEPHCLGRSMRHLS